MSSIHNGWELKIAARLFIFGAILTLLILGSSIFIPFTIAIFFTFLLYPVSSRLERYRIPRAIAIIISLFMAIIVFGGLIYFFIDQLNNFRNDLPQLKIQLVDKGSRLLNWIEDATNIPQEKQINWLKEKAAASAESGPQLLVGIFSTTGTFIAMFALIPLYIFFLTYFRDKYKQFIILVDKTNHDQTWDIIRKISLVSKNYLKGLFIDIVILSILGSVGYLVLGIKHAILFGVLAALLNIIPYVGSLIGSILPVLMALITKDEIGYAVGALGVALVVQFIDNNFLAPYVIGSSVSINPLTAIIVLLIGALVWGIAGMILSLPVAGMIKVACDNIEPLKPYGYLIGEEVNFSQKRFFKPRPKKTK
jgi:predicted PurR-regulated permease PerM